jgi:hypothetical protein
MSIALLIGGALAILACTVWMLLRRLGRRDKDDLGSISDSWVNQHRASTHDPGH